MTTRKESREKWCVLNSPQLDSTAIKPGSEWWDLNTLQCTQYWCDQTSSGCKISAIDFMLSERQSSHIEANAASAREQLCQRLGSSRRSVARWLFNLRASSLVISANDSSVTQLPTSSRQAAFSSWATADIIATRR